MIDKTQGLKDRTFETDEEADAYLMGLKDGSLYAAEYVFGKVNKVVEKHTKKVGGNGYHKYCA